MPAVGSRAQTLAARTDAQQCDTRVMEATIDIDPGLLHRLEREAVLQGTSVRTLVESAVQWFLDSNDRSSRIRRVRLPLVPADPGGPLLFAGMSQAEIHRRLEDLLLEDDRSRVE